MSHQRYPEGYMVVVHSLTRCGVPSPGLVRAGSSGATTTLRHPTRKQGAGSTRPPRCAGGWVPRTATLGGPGRGEEVVLIPHQG